MGMQRRELDSRLAKLFKIASGKKSAPEFCLHVLATEVLVAAAIHHGVTVKLLASMTHSSVLDPEWKSEAHTSTPGEERWGAEAFLKDDRKVFWVPGPWPLASAVAIARVVGVLGAEEEVSDA